MGEHSRRASLPEAFRTISVPAGLPWWRKGLIFMGPGFLVAVGYMDPGNWATDLAGGSRFAYALLSVVLFSNLAAIVLQGLAATLGIATGRDLAQACKEHYSRPTAIFLWLLCELAIIACDLAEVLGTAIALQLLFGLPLLMGVLLTACDVLVLLALQRRHFRWMEGLVMALIAFIAVCFAWQLFWAGPDWGAIAHGFIPGFGLVKDPSKLYLAIAIIGATVMPHNLYLHSAIVQTRAYDQTSAGRKEALKWSVLDSTGALMIAFFINAGILILAAAVFHTSGHTDVAEIQQAFKLLVPLLGAPLAGIVFACALLASGQNSTITGTLAGQIVMEGFLDISLPGWARRLITRSLAIVPAVFVIAWLGEKGSTGLLLVSQVVLSLQLPFAMFPLLKFTSDPLIMGEFTNGRWLKRVGYLLAFIITALNGFLVFQLARELCAW